MDNYTEIADKAFVGLFCGKQDRGDGLAEIPHEGYQLVVSALEAIRWETRGEDRDTINAAIAICEWLRDEQKKREWARIKNWK